MYSRKLAGTMSLSAAQMLPDCSSIADVLEKPVVHQLVDH